MPRAHVYPGHASLQVNADGVSVAVAAADKFFFAPVSYLGDSVFSPGYDSHDEAVRAAHDAGFDVDRPDENYVDDEDSDDMDDVYDESAEDDDYEDDYPEEMEDPNFDDQVYADFDF